MATFITQPNGRIRARIRRDGVSTSKTFRLKSDAEAWARREESRVERGRWDDMQEAKATTLAAALERYKEERTESKRGALQEKSVIGILSETSLAKLPLSKIESGDVESIIKKWEQEGLKPGTIRRRLNVLRNLFTVARRNWKMKGLVNPVADAELPRVNDARARRISDKEIAEICKNTGSSVLAAFLRLAIESGMRRGEIASLTWNLIDLQDRVILLEKTKNGSPREVPLSPAAVRLLKSLSRPPADDEDQRVFKVKANSITQAFIRARNRAGLTDIRLHDSRHEATSRLGKVLDGKKLSKIIGHSDPKMTNRYYHPSVKEIAKELAQAEDAKAVTKKPIKKRTMV